MTDVKNCPMGDAGCVVLSLSSHSCCNPNKTERTAGPDYSASEAHVPALRKMTVVNIYICIRTSYYTPPHIYTVYIKTQTFMMKAEMNINDINKVQRFD